MDFIYTAVLFTMMFLNIGVMLLQVRLLSVVFGFVTLGIVAQAWNTSIYGEIPFSPNFQLLTALTAVVCMLVVGVRGKHVA